MNPIKRTLSARCGCCAGPFAASPVSRRALLTGGAALGLAAATGFGAKAQAKPQRIDVHHHLSPPTWTAALKKANAGQPPSYNWSVQKSLDDMDAAGVTTSITSITTPGLEFLNKDDAVRVARESNDYAAKLMADHPGRFGIFAILPVPFIDESLKEIAYALDTLKADGVCLMTSYGDKWLGHKDFAPVMDELNRRKAVVYTHPTVANCCRNLMPELPDPVVEFGTDTTRTIGSLVFSGTSQRVKDINFIFSHAGGTMPFLAERFTRLSTMTFRVKEGPALTPDKVLAELRRFYYDTAQVAHPMALTSLTELIPTSRIVFGTDFPFRTSEDHVKGLTEFFSAEDLKKVDHENTWRLIPRLKAA
jgi:predicted TIM-barrel fold metal-dependent hydrolase